MPPDIPAAKLRPVTPRTATAPRSCIRRDRKSTRLNSSHSQISYAVFCLKKKKTQLPNLPTAPIMPSTPLHRCHHSVLASPLYRLHVSPPSHHAPLHAIPPSLLTPPTTCP